jgi:hypothetical protein
MLPPLALTIAAGPVWARQDVEVYRMLMRASRDAGE